MYIVKRIVNGNVITIPAQWSTLEQVLESKCVISGDYVWFDDAWMGQIFLPTITSISYELRK